MDHFLLFSLKSFLGCLSPVALQVSIVMGGADLDVALTCTSLPELLCYSGRKSFHQFAGPSGGGGNLSSTNKLRRDMVAPLIVSALLRLQSYENVQYLLSF
jgi:hypothetical protein